MITQYFLFPVSLRRNEEKYYHICDLENTVLATKGQQKRLFIVILKSSSPRVGKKLPSGNDLTAVAGPCI